MITVDRCFVGSIESRAAARGRECTLTREYLANLFENQNGECDLSGKILSLSPARSRTASIDRIDSKVGYVEGNVRFLHKDVNRMRGSLSDEQFLQLARDVFAPISGPKPDKITKSQADTLCRRISHAGRDLIFELTYLDIYRLWNKQQGRCALTGRELLMPFSNSAKTIEYNASVDRINNFGGYHPRNIQLVDKQVNMSKSWFKQEYFEETMAQIYFRSNTN